MSLDIKSNLAKSEREWESILTAAQFKILRLKRTEPPWSGSYNKTYEEGTYFCSGCDTPLYNSRTKFDSGCGWPAFYESIPGRVNRIPEADGRTEIVCNSCGGHLGHVFEREGFDTPTDERHCVNSISLTFKKP
ncbi:methionine sulfoxide reductase [Globomyces pollinis-pini]|nr:methionine sulfoxide reductase [Globomyces pollinis-pini]